MVTEYISIKQSSLKWNVKISEIIKELYLDDSITPYNAAHAVHLKKLSGLYYEQPKQN